MAARLMRQAEVMERRARPKDLNRALAPPCRPVEAVPDALVAGAYNRPLVKPQLNCSSSATTDRVNKPR
jgi:hypothetical protein